MIGCLFAPGIAMRHLNELILRFSSSPWLFGLAFVVAFGSLFAVFGPITLAFGELTGGEQPFDLQNRLTVEQIFAQLPHYTETARQLYYAFSFVDFFFPFFAGIFLAAIAAFSLRHLSPRAYAWVNARNLFVLMMTGTACDWAENCLALVVISQYPQQFTGVATALVLVKQAKLFFVLLAQLVGWSLLLLAGLKWLGQRLGLFRERA
jgi:hypothetical protein